jgi:hypothetical protein
VGTDAAGGFAVAHATPGRYLVAARKDGWVPAEVAVDVEPGAPPEPVLLRLERAGGLALAVRLASGEVPGLVTVAVFDAAGGLLVTDTRGPTDAGYVAFEQVPAGTWRALVGAVGAAPVWIAAAVPGPEVEVVLAPGAPLTVRVPALIATGSAATLTLAGGAGNPFFQVEPGGAIRSRWSLATGLITLADVPAGVWTLRVDDLEGGTWAGTAVTDGAAPAVVTLE